MNCLRGDKPIALFQTKDFNSESISFGDFTIYSWTLCEDEKSRPIWRHYFTNAKGIIIVADSSDSESLPKLKQEIDGILKMQEVEDCPVLVFANKQDTDNSVSVDDIKKEIEMDSWAQKDQNIVASNAMTGEGINVGMKWLQSMIK